MNPAERMMELLKGGKKIPHMVEGSNRVIENSRAGNTLASLKNKNLRGEAAKSWGARAGVGAAAVGAGAAAAHAMKDHGQEKKANMNSLSEVYGAMTEKDQELLEKQAAMKIAADEEDAAGRIMARGFADELHKLADGVPSIPAASQEIVKSPGFGSLKLGPTSGGGGPLAQHGTPGPIDPQPQQGQVKGMQLNNAATRGARGASKGGFGAAGK